MVLPIPRVDKLKLLLQKVGALLLLNSTLSNEFSSKISKLKYELKIYIKSEGNKVQFTQFLGSFHKIVTELKTKINTGSSLNSDYGNIISKIHNSLAKILMKSGIEICQICQMTDLEFKEDVITHHTLCHRFHNYCGICRLEFDTPLLATQHKETKHSELTNPISCIKCKINFPSYFHRNLHLSFYHRKNINICPNQRCHYPCITPEEMKNGCHSLHQLPLNWGDRSLILYKSPIVQVNKITNCILDNNKRSKTDMLLKLKKCKKCRLTNLGPLSKIKCRCNNEIGNRPSTLPEKSVIGSPTKPEERPTAIILTTPTIEEFDIPNFPSPLIEKSSIIPCTTQGKSQFLFITIT